MEFVQIGNNIVKIDDIESQILCTNPIELPNIIFPANVNIEKIIWNK